MRWSQRQLGILVSSTNKITVLRRKNLPHLVRTAWYTFSVLLLLVSSFSTAPHAALLNHRLHGYWSDTTVTIAMSVCGNKQYEALISLKSAFLHLTETNTYAFHIWTDRPHHVLKSTLSTFVRYNLGRRVPITLRFHKVIEDSSIQRMFARCSANRLLMPKQMAQMGMNKYIYVDIDTIWLDDPANLMALFNDFDDAQQFGMALEVEGGNWSYYQQHQTSQRPFYGSGGLQAGVGLYRVFDADETLALWREIIQRHEGDLALGDNDVLNAHLANDPAVVFELPCRWNFRTDGACRFPGLPGIVHGNRQLFYGRIRDDIFSASWEFTRLFKLKHFVDVDIPHNACCMPCPHHWNFTRSDELRRKIKFRYLADQLSHTSIRQAQQYKLYPHHNFAVDTVHIVYSICDSHVQAALLSIKSLLLTTLTDNKQRQHIHIFYQDSVNVRDDLELFLESLSEVLPLHITVSAHLLEFKSMHKKVSACTSARFESIRLTSGRVGQFIMVDSDTIWAENPYELWKVSTSNSSKEFWFVDHNGLYSTGVGIYNNVDIVPLLRYIDDYVAAPALDHVFAIDFHELLTAYVKASGVTVKRLPCRWNQEPHQDCDISRVHGIIHLESQRATEVNAQSMYMRVIKEAHLPPLTERHDNFAVCCNLGCHT